jgi:hypothetical protein
VESGEQARCVAHSCFGCCEKFHVHMPVVVPNGARLLLPCSPSAKTTFPTSRRTSGSVQLHHLSLRSSDTTLLYCSHSFLVRSCLRPSALRTAPGGTRSMVSSFLNGARYSD